MQVQCPVSRKRKERRLEQRSEKEKRKQKEERIEEGAPYTNDDGLSVSLSRQQVLGIFFSLRNNNRPCSQTSLLFFLMFVSRSSNARQIAQCKGGITWTMTRKFEVLGKKLCRGSRLCAIETLVSLCVMNVWASSDEEGVKRRNALSRLTTLLVQSVFTIRSALVSARYSRGGTT
jgi:hypothetical protein